MKNIEKKNNYSEGDLGDGKKECLRFILMP